MTNANKEIELLVLREYSHDYILGDEIDCIEGLMEYSDSKYISDAITEQSDSYVPIYNHQVWENVANIQDYVEQGVTEFGVDSEIDLIEIFQRGYFLYYSELLYSNLDVFKFNYVITAVNEFIKAHKLKLNISDIEIAIDEELEDIDDNSTYHELNEIIQNIVESISMKLA